MPRPPARASTAPPGIRAPSGGGAPALFAICLGFFMVLMDTSALNVALPRIREEFSGSLAGLEWIVSGYTVAMAASLLGGGSFGDRWGSRRVFQVSLLGFVLSSAACAASPTLPMLIAARVVQGVTAGGLLPASLALLAHMYPDPVRRARALTIWGGVSSLALVTGPVVGGVLTTEASWRTVFLINVPIGMIAVVLTRRTVAETPIRATPFDPLGQLAAALVISSGVGMLIEGGAEGWHAAIVWALGALTLVSLAAFAAAERRTPHPMLPLSLFAVRRFVLGLAIGALFQFGAYGGQFAISLYLQNTWGLDAFRAGVAFIPFATAWAIASFVLARAVSRTGPRAVLIAGAGIAAVGAVILLVLGRSNDWPVFIAGSCVLGLGAGLMGPSLPVVVLGALPAHQSGLASGALNASRQVGGSVAIALFGLLLESFSPVSGLHACLALIAAGFLAAIPAVAAAGLPV